MRKILLAAFLLTATLTVTPGSNAKQANVHADKKLPWAVATTLDIVLNDNQMNLVSYTFTKERNEYLIDFIGSADYDGTGLRFYEGHVSINNRGTLLSASILPMD